MSRFGEYDGRDPPPQNGSWGLYGPRRVPTDASGDGSPPLRARWRRGSVSEPLDQPLVVVALDELGDHVPGLLERLEPMEREALLLQRPHEALDDAVALGLAHIRRR